MASNISRPAIPSPPSPCTAAWPSKSCCQPVPARRCRRASKRSTQPTSSFPGRPVSTGCAKSGGCSEGETVLVLGASGSTGTTAIECAKALGAKVIACASSEDKRQHCLDHGADQVVDYTQDGWRDEVKAATNKRGVDAVYDPVGGDMSEAALRLMAPGGRFLVVGFVAGIAKIPMNLPLLKRCSLHGVNWGGTVMDDPSVVPPVIKTLAEWTMTGAINPAPTQTYKLEEAGRAFAALFGRRSSGSLVVIP
ncbi:MAG: zinc-binding dehydrogenase [Xanthomonadales bacterium]|nr:zinc-binding dehydrogenase [Xanthomonadales bacterium]